MTSNNNRKLTLKKNDECYTPDKVWDDISYYLPHNGIVFEPFYGEGHTFRYLQKLYSKVLGKRDLDFFSEESDRYLKQCDIVISNPPFSIKFKILQKLIEFNKPFILLFPLGSINTTKFVNIIKNKTKDTSIIVPNGRIKFIIDGSLAKSPSFETIYLLYKIETEQNLIFLDE